MSEFDWKKERACVDREESMPKKDDAPYMNDPLLDAANERMLFYRDRLRRYAEIGMALSGEEDMSKLLEMIVYEAREITNADAGTLYMVSEFGSHLDFVILQNQSMRVYLGGKGEEDLGLPPVPLYVQQEENHAHVSSHVALSGEIINIPDVYESTDFDFSGTRGYDESTGYRSKSMLVIPMRNHENHVIGVLQLLNGKDMETGEIIAFHDEHVGLIAALASQAAVTITRSKLINDLRELLDAFIKSIAKAIEEKSKYTGGHIARVRKLTLMLAECINEVDEGVFKDTSFNDDEMEELRVAAWLHDIGKIITAQHVVDKATKLETIYDRIGLLRTRFDYMHRTLEVELLNRKIALLEGGDNDAIPALEQEYAEKMAALNEERSFVEDCNSTKQFLDDESVQRLEKLATKTYQDVNGQTLPYLDENELENLSIRKGTLNQHERVIIESHAIQTYRLLSELPFPEKLRNVPDYASHHHERVDGKGYPFNLSGDELSLQARIMAVADIFEALTAKDRPYKHPMPLSQAVKILGFMKDDGHIDPEVFNVLINSGLIDEYAQSELNPEQVDRSFPVTTKMAKRLTVDERVQELINTPPQVTPKVFVEPDFDILVVEDSVNTRTLIQYYLSDGMFKSQSAKNGLKALQKYVTGCFHLVLMDLDMPVLDGYATARAMRAWEEKNGVEPRAIVALLSHTQAGEAELRKDAGFTGAITKPLTKKKLNALLTGFLPDLDC